MLLMMRPRGGRTRIALIAAGLVALVAAGGASAYAVAHTIMLAPGHCKTVHGEKVCARKVSAKTVVHTTTVDHTDTVTKTVTKTVTVTVFPSPIGKTFSGNGDAMLAPMTLSAGDEISWTSSPDEFDNNIFSVTSSPDDSNIIDFDNGDSSTSGSSFIPAGHYVLQVIASGAWTISF
jgi:hypothetical protein